MTGHEPSGTVNAAPPAQSRCWLGILILLVATLVAYGPAWHAGYIWDDDAYVTENPTLRSLDGLKAIWLKPTASPQYYPLVFTTFWVEHHLWGLHSPGYHLVNILLHALNAVLLWRVLRRLQVPGSWWAAALFALHPVMVESVAWVTERKNVLSGFFYLLTVLAFLRFRPLNNQEATANRNWRFYPLILVWFVGALLSKTVTCSLPAALLLLLWWKAGRVEKRDALALAPMFGLGAALGLATVWLEKYHVGASGADWTLTFGERCLLAGRALWFYAGKLFWPEPLTFIYPRWEIDGRAAWQYVFPLAVLAVLLALWWRRRSLGRGPLVAVLFFAGTLAPALGFIDVYPFRFSFVADHFQYLAGIGLIALTAGAGTMMCERLGRWGRRAGFPVAGLVLLALGMLTWRQAGIYKNAETLWLDTLKKNPGCWLAHNNLGVYLMRANRLAEAIQHGEQALQLKSDYPEARFNLGCARLQSGAVAEAIEQFKQAIRLQPDFPAAHNSLGNALFRLQKVPEAMAEFTEAIRLKPDYAEARNNLANILLLQGQGEAAAREYERALQINPDYADAHYHLGLALIRLDRPDEAIAHYRKAITLQPDHADAHGNLANVLTVLGRLDEAIAEYQQTLALIPNSVQAHFRYGQALLAQRRYQAASAEFEKTLKLDPAHLPVRISLAWLLATCPDPSIRDGEKAVAQAEQARARAGIESPQLLDTLAAAYAEAGRFPEAVETARRALTLPATQNNPPLNEAIQARLKLYEAHSPYHEKP
jgi:protein O-mannosyl-transferase